MKKLTAGILTVLVGLVSVNAADAAVASKGYVDGKFFTKDDQQSHVVAQKAIDDAQDVNISKNAQDIAANAEDIAANAEGIAANKRGIGNLSFTGANYVSTAADLTAAVTALDAEVKKVAGGELDLDANAVDTVNIKDGAVTVGKLANDVTSLIAEKQTSEQVASAISTALQNYDTSTVVDGKVKVAKDAADAAQAKANANADEIAGMKNETTGILATAKSFATQEANEAESAAKAYAKTYADQKVNGLNLADISRVPAACSNANNYCTLTTDGTKFVWEVIARGDGEETPSATEGAERLLVTVPGVSEPAVTQ